MAILGQLNKEVGVTAKKEGFAGDIALNIRVFTFPRHSFILFRTVVDDHENTAKTRYSSDRKEVADGMGTEWYVPF